MTLKSRYALILLACAGSIAGLKLYKNKAKQTARVKCCNDRLDDLFNDEDFWN